MKQIALFALLLPLLPSCTNPTPTLITGSLSNSPDSQALLYTAPLSGTTYGGFRDTLPLDKTGNFELKLSLKQPTSIRIWLPEPLLAVKIIAEPGGSYHIDMDATQKTAHISGANEKGQTLYAALPDPAFIEMEANRLNLSTDSSLTSIHTKIETLKQSDLSSFKALLDSGEITKSFLKLVQIDRDCYYAALEAEISINKAFERLETKQFVLPNGENVLKNLAKIYAQYPPNNKKLRFSPFWNQYAEQYITHYKLITRKDFDLNKIREMYENGTIHTFYINESKNFLTGKSREFFQATHLYFTALQKNYEQELIPLFHQFEKDFPNSEYTKYLQPLIAQIILYHQTIENPLAETIQFMPDYEHINTLEEAIQPFRGKKLYIDVWATWCVPCKEEFKHHQALQKILNEQDIQPLYISVDRDDHDRQWKESIRFYELSGAHIRTNELLHKDLIHRFDKNAKKPYLAIPWYILVDEEGRIIKEHAARPSQIIEDPNLLHNKQ